MDTRTFLMMGRPGSGKGTQAKLLADKIGGVVYSSGNRLRPMSQTDTPFGHKAKQVMESGDLMPEWASEFLFEEALIGLRAEDGIVFEGACRRELEAVKFHEVSTWLERPYITIYLDASETVLMDRLLKRYTLQNRPDDANSEVIKNRFDKFTKNTLPAVNHFKKEGTLLAVNGDQSVEAVHADVLKALHLS
ncbi:MAG TPA: nucleoside monophosphate kinase [Candidatus Paceibacterota bacterium]|nr:nucleoside monophosphate kinase [Candidatus Paceibacterota bacterium]